MVISARLGQGVSDSLGLSAGILLYFWSDRFFSSWQRRALWGYSLQWGMVSRLGGAGHGLHHEGREQTEARSQAESQLSMLAQSTVGVPVRLRIWGSDSGLRSGISCWKEQ